MYQDLLVIDADAHKLENPLILRDYIAPEYRDRVGLVVDSLGDQRAQIRDWNPATGAYDYMRMFPQPQGLGKGGFRNLHPETTLGAMFNRIRIEHMDREGIDVHVIYGTLNLIFSSILDKDLGIALCRAYNDYITDDCRPYGDRLKPVGVLPLQDVDEAVKEMHRCVEELGTISVAVAPNLPVPHPSAPDAFPEIRTCKAISHPDFRPILQAAVDLDIALAIHGGPGSYMMGGISDHTETFVLTHVFVQRNQQQHALARMVFDGAFEQFPTLRVGFLEGGCGWIPDLAHAFHEHWEKRIRDFDPQHPYRPSLMEFTKLMIQEKGGKDQINIISKARNLFDLMWSAQHDPTKIDDASLFEHSDLRHRDPMDYFERGQVFASFESDDPGPSYMAYAMGETGKRIPCFSGDYGHWDGVLTDSVKDAATCADYDRDHLARLLGGNALSLYGDRLRKSLPQSVLVGTR
ncbi:putative metal-dependent hydrolase of the TIM-barrel fold protein [Rubidibacter lacunae KORDI 51-2]|uniref:Putative metal-dependent hydrolase of the TIM-barrel fold protein n=1 Tax=Rubidibacter lacunae KORDI 51-2 TaxID=582515 RepID=U5D810_9CHRO|nr:amidohydrolase family protein [Rubidibacter lacunae]ERN40763.1 putative metal-dependent hydrolase of the TIM-barrel fold protein [Rubidibacter lacunae KORDI 51-2]